MATPLAPPEKPTSAKVVYMPRPKNLQWDPIICNVMAPRILCGAKKPWRVVLYGFWTNDRDRSVNPDPRTP
ncbi:hypothetical protein NDU88_003844 [Pleurodeles waltl]|uniref:Uncharacterized protein n=1 Tax=Pleurodeles waltl TaxID=8319 RepID=A0AAV7MWS0_PLEWA|nr:hypothetical protein NDU88_003844 [Pleurodeles waltl]